MTSSRPYLLRAIYQWVVDNQLTPYLLVDATTAGVDVPKEFVENGKIVLNIGPMAAHALLLGNELVTFSARFNGIARDLSVPVHAVLAIYAKENGQGMLFSEEDSDPVPTPPAGPDNPTTTGGRPALKLVK